MKHVGKFILAAAALTFLGACSEKDDSLPPISGSMVREYLIPDKMDAELEITHEGTAYFRCGFTGKTVKENTAGFDMLAVGFGDINYSDKGVSYSASALGSKITAIHVTADADYDAQHPAGSSLDGLFRLYGVTFSDYVRNGYERERTSDPVTGLPLISWTRSEGRTLYRHLDETEAEDLYLLSFKDIFLVPDHLPATALNMTVTFERLGEKPLVSTFRIDPAAKKYLPLYDRYLLPDTLIMSFASRSYNSIGVRGSFQGKVIGQDAAQFNSLARTFSDTCYIPPVDKEQTRIPVGAPFHAMDITASVDYGPDYPAGSSLAALATYTGQTAYPFVKEQYPVRFTQKKVQEMQDAGFEMPEKFFGVHKKPVPELTADDLYMLGDNNNTTTNTYRYGEFRLHIDYDQIPMEQHELTVTIRQKDGPDLTAVYHIDAWLD